MRRKRLGCFFRMHSTDESTHPYRAFDLIEQEQISFLLEAYRKSAVWSFIVVILVYRSRTNKEKKQQIKLACGVIHQFKQSSLGGYGGILLSVWYGTLSWGWWCSWNEETVGQQNPRNLRVCQEDFQTA